MTVFTIYAPAQHCRIHDVFGDYEILIPNYDADTVCGMLNLSVDV